MLFSEGNDTGANQFPFITKTEFRTRLMKPIYPSNYRKWINIYLLKTVNRHWQRFFGVGLVKTSEDFGVQGERPMHQDLLDSLAVEFRESGWNVKQLFKLMVSSAAYRQSAKATRSSSARWSITRISSLGRSWPRNASMRR